MGRRWKRDRRYVDNTAPPAHSEVGEFEQDLINMSREEMEVMANDPKIENERYNTDITKLWVCPACGRYEEYDRYNMGDTSCVVNARLYEKDRCVITGQRVTEIKSKNNE